MILPALFFGDGKILRRRERGDRPPRAPRKPGADAVEWHLAQGFSFSAVTAGIKASGRPDLALISVEGGASAAAVFTRNRLVAAPLEVARKYLAQSRGRVRGVVVNSGNANCATGRSGRMACERVCGETGRWLGVDPREIFPSSTGIIGVPLPVDKIVAQLGDLVASRRGDQEGLRKFADAIMTTDTRPKIASAQVRIGKKSVSLVGVAKGSGMIHPQLATMLVYLMTDVAASPGELRAALHRVCDETFNCISVDGDTSTNDTVLLLAGGASGVRLKDAGKKFEAALLEVCQSLAEQIVSDGEGVQHVIRLHIEQAKSRAEGLRVAKAIAHSLLVKTAFAGADPNWGRIVAAVGACGVPVRPGWMDVSIGSQMVFRRGTGCEFDQERAHAELSQSRCDVRVRLRRGSSEVIFFTTDLTAEYVRVNAEYST